MWFSKKLSWAEIRKYLKENLSDYEPNIVSERYYYESFGSGHVIYQTRGQLFCLNFDKREEQVFILKTEKPVFDFRSSTLMKTFCLWEYSNKKLALEDIGKSLKSILGNQKRD